MHVQSGGGNRGFVMHGGEHPGNPFGVDPKLGLAGTSRGVAMGVGIDVGIDPDRNWGHAAEMAGHHRDRLEFLFTLDVDRSDSRPERGFDFGGGLADPGIDASGRRNSRFECSMEFAAAHHVHARSKAAQQAENREIGIALDRKTDERMNGCECVAESLVVRGQRGGRIDEGGGADLFGNRRDVDFFGVEAAGSVIEVVHACGRVIGVGAA